VRKVHPIFPVYSQVILEFIPRFVPVSTLLAGTPLFSRFTVRLFLPTIILVSFNTFRRFHRGFPRVEELSELSFLSVSLRKREEDLTLRGQLGENTVGFDKNVDMRFRE